MSEQINIQEQRRIANFQADYARSINYRGHEVTLIDRRGTWYYGAEELCVSAQVLDDLLDMIDEEIAHDYECDED